MCFVSNTAIAYNGVMGVDSMAEKNKYLIAQTLLNELEPIDLMRVGLQPRD